MINKNMIAALNKQITEEIYSAYLYLSMSSYCSYIGLKGASVWFFVQTQEEMTHAYRLQHYIARLGEEVVLGAIKKPPTEFKSLTHMYEEALKHEKFITACISDLVNLAVAEKDRSTEAFLQWFVNEQVEEEENDMDVLAKLRLAGKDGSALLMIDNELATRTFVLAPDLTLPGQAGAAAAGA
jgi:ferritin